MSLVRETLSKKYKQSPQYEYMWLVMLPDLRPETSNPLGISGTEITSPAGAGSFFPSELNDPEEISHRVQSIEAPFTSYDTKKNTDRSTFMYTATNSDIGSVSLEVDEMTDGLSLRYFEFWKSLISNDNGTYNLPYFYKRSLVLFKLSPDGQMLHSSRYIGYFPTEIDSASHNYESDGVLTYNVTLTGDSVEHTFIPVGEVKAKIQSAQQELMREKGFDSFIMDDDLLGNIASIINKGATIF